MHYHSTRTCMRTHNLKFCTEIDFEQSQLLPWILWYKRFLSLFSKFLFLHFKSCEKNPWSFLVQGIFLDLLNGWYLPQCSLNESWKWCMQHKCEILITEGWQAGMEVFSFKFQNRIFNFFFLFFSPWEKIETIFLWCRGEYGTVLHVPFIFIPSFFHALHFSVLRQGRSLTTTGTAAELT